MTETCALDVADRGPVTLEAIAQMQVITRERVRQIELTAMRRMEEALAIIMADDDQFGKAAIRSLAERATPEMPKSLSDFQLKGKRQRVNVTEWLSEVGSPPVD